MWCPAIQGPHKKVFLFRNVKKIATTICQRIFGLMHPIISCLGEIEAQSDEFLKKQMPRRFPASARPLLPENRCPTDWASSSPSPLPHGPTRPLGKQDLVAVSTPPPPWCPRPLPAALRCSPKQVPHSPEALLGGDDCPLTPPQAACSRFLRRIQPSGLQKGPAHGGPFPPRAGA